MAGSSAGDGRGRRGPGGTLKMEAANPPAPNPAPPSPAIPAYAPPTAGGDHWPIPQDVLARLPKLPVPQSLEPKGAQVPFRGQGSAVEWLRYAVSVHWRDKDAEQRKKTLMIWGVVLLVVGIPLLFAFGLGLVPIGVAIYLFVRRSRYDKLDIEDRRLEAFTGTLTALAPELKRRRPLSVALDFTAYTEHGAPGAPNGQAYVQRWLTLDLPLRDGSSVGVEVCLQVKQKSRSKRKYTKLKARLVEVITVRIAAPSGKTFGPSPGLARHQGRTMAGLSLQRIASGPRQTTFTWTTWPTLRTRGRSGWTTQGPERIDSRQLTAAIITSYRLTACETARTA